MFQKYLKKISGVYVAAGFSLRSCSLIIPFRTLGAILLTALLSWGAYPDTVKAASWSFVYMGDQRDDGATGVDYDVVNAMAAHIATLNPAPALVLLGGDKIHRSRRCVEGCPFGYSIFQLDDSHGSHLKRTIPRLPRPGQP